MHDELNINIKNMGDLSRQKEKTNTIHGRKMHKHNNIQMRKRKNK